MPSNQLDGKAVVERMQPPASGRDLARETLALVGACVGLIALLFLVVYLLTVS